MITLERIKAVVFGHAVADALGVPVEFRSRDELKEKPVKDMMGYGTYPVPAGSWSDDTSMSIAALDSLAKGTLDYDDIMRNFVKWYYEAEYTPTGKTFDVGNTCKHAIDNYYTQKLPWNKCGLTDEQSNGNGSLMRIYPFALFTYAKEMSLGKSLDIIHKASSLTHAHPRSIFGCGIYSMILWKLLEHPSKDAIANEIESAYVLYDSGISVSEKEYDHYAELEHYDFAYKAQVKNKKESEIHSSGYVVHTLEAALWCLLTTDSYRDCVLKAVNLGKDTDSVTAVAGGLAGALYGLDAIPTEWLNTLKRYEYIEQMCENAYTNWLKGV